MNFTERSPGVLVRVACAEGNDKLIRIDHVGIVSETLDDATQVLVDKLGFHLDLVRNAVDRAAENGRTKIKFVKVGIGETRVEILLPEDPTTGIGKFLKKRGPGLHHICYASDDLAADAERLQATGLAMIPGEDPEEAGGCFFYPKSMDGILTEILAEGRHYPGEDKK